MKIDPKKYKKILKTDRIQTVIRTAIFDSSSQGAIVPLDEVKYEKLYEAINKALLEDLDKCGVLPKFSSNECICGIMKINCYNPEAKAWLADMIERAPPLWQNMQLKVEDFDQLALPNRVIGVFPHCKFTAQEIQRMLNLMNPKFNVNSWTIIRSKTFDPVQQTFESATCTVFDIPESDLINLRKCNFQLYFGAGKSQFRDITMEHGEPWE